MVTVLRDTYSKILYNQNVKLFRMNKVSSLRSNSIMVSVPDCLSGYQGSIPTGAVYNGVSPSGKALEFDSSIRRFDSYYPSFADIV